MIAIYARYHCIEQNDDHDTLADAIQCLESIEDNGHGYALGVYDPTTLTFHIPENMNIAGKTRESVLEEKNEELKKLGYLVEKIEFYQRH